MSSDYCELKKMTLGPVHNTYTPQPTPTVSAEESNPPSTNAYADFSVTSLAGNPRSSL